MAFVSLKRLPQCDAAAVFWPTFPKGLETETKKSYNI